MKKFLWITGLIIFLGLATFLWAHYYYVFGQGMKYGDLNYVVQKGVLFKTYEGELILPGLQSRGMNTVQSNEFLFSVPDSAVAQKLMLNSGHKVRLHYKEYFGAIPWRGYSKFVVDRIVAIDSLAQ